MSYGETREDPRTEIARLRTPPHSIEAEQSVLGALLLDNAAFERVADLLTEADFYRHDHRLIFGAVTGLISQSRPADVITVFERLQGLGQAAEAGGMPYLTALSNSIPSAAHARRYAEIVAERATLRRMIAASDEIATAAFNPQGRSTAELLDQAERKMLAIGQARARGESGRTMRALMLALSDRLSDLHERGASEIVGVPTGFRDLDRKTTGLQRGDLFIVAARPSMGKTAFALNIAEHVAVRERLGVVVFSMEMSATQLGARLAASNGRIDQQRLRTGALTPEDWSRFSEANDRLAQAPMMIDEASGLSIDAMRALARRHARSLGVPLGLIVVDYLQLMSGSGSGDENRATELGAISRGLKGMAKELDCPVIALSQINRGVEQRQDKRPLMSDLRESGAIEQDADVVAFIYRDDYYNKDSKTPGVAEIILAKQRNGPTGTVDLAWLSPFTRFDNLAHDYVRPPPESDRAKSKGVHL